MSTIVIIPIKAPPDRKSRLAEVLDAPSRDRLVLAMAGHVAQVARQAQGVDRVCFLTAAPDGLPPQTDIIPDAGGGLNAALRMALIDRTESRVLIVAGDLPLLSAREIELLVAVPDATLAVAPDRHGVGTNALSLPLPAARAFRFAFGRDSLAFHRAEAERLGLELAEVRSAGLARDIDLPDDLPDLPDLPDAADLIDATRKA